MHLLSLKQPAYDKQTLDSVNTFLCKTLIQCLTIDSDILDYKFAST